MGAKEERFPSPTIDSTQEIHNFKAYTISDNAGNSKDCPETSIYVYVDKDPPTCTVVKKEPNSWKPDGVTVTVTCSDTGGSKLKKCAGETTSPQSKTTTKNGKQYHAEDNAGNNIPCPAISVSSRTEYSKRTRSAKDCSDYKCGTDSCATGNQVIVGYEQKTIYGVCSLEGCTDTGDVVGNAMHACKCPVYGPEYVNCPKYCGFNGSICGYTAWSGWSDWATNNNCSSNVCESKSRVTYN